jgi:fructose-1,6-bisphosphatase/inositol monophosphatase family enzyme
VRGAGGVVSDWDGRPDPLGGRVIAASGPELLDEALTLMRLPRDVPPSTG